MAARECLPQRLHATMRGRGRIHALEALLERRNLERVLPLHALRRPLALESLQGW